VSKVFHSCPQEQAQRSSLRGDQPQSGHRMRGPEGLSIFSSSGSRSITTDELSSLTGHMPRYYALLGAMAECEIAEWYVTFGLRNGDGGAESMVVTQRNPTDSSRACKWKSPTNLTWRHTAGIDFRRTVPFPKGLRRMAASEIAKYRVANLAFSRVRANPVAVASEISQSAMINRLVFQRRDAVPRERPNSAQVRTGYLPSVPNHCQIRSLPGSSA
jgi:hypothetical protein